jgi:hypothetical protein
MIPVLASYQNIPVVAKKIRLGQNKSVKQSTQSRQPHDQSLAHPKEEEKFLRPVHPGNPIYLHPIHP